MVNWNDYVEEKEKENYTFVPEGIYEVTVSDVRRKSQWARPESFFTVISFEPIDEGVVPPMFVMSGYKSDNPKTEQFIHYKAVCLTNEIYKAADIDPAGWDLDDGDPIYDGLSRIIGARLKVLVETNPKTGRAQTVPLVQCRG